MSPSGTSTVFRRVLQRSPLRPVLVLLALSSAVPARAASDVNGDDPQLEASLQRGVALRRAGNDEAALALFIDLERTHPDSVRVLLNITAAAQATGRWLMAHSYLKRAFSHKNEAYFIRYRNAIKSIEDATAQHIGQFRAVGTPLAAEVRLNGELIGTLPMAAPTPVEVGQYILEVSKTGFYPLRRTVSVAPGNALTQESVALRVATEPANALAGATGEAHSDASDAQREQDWWRARWVTWALGGATVVTAATSMGALIVRNNRADEWNSSACLSGTMTREEVCGHVHDATLTAQNVAIGTGIAALMFGGATVTQAILASERAPVASAAAKLKGPSIQCNPGLAGIACFGSF